MFNTALTCKNCIAIYAVGLEVLPACSFRLLPQPQNTKNGQSRYGFFESGENAIACERY